MDDIKKFLREQANAAKAFAKDNGAKTTQINDEQVWVLGLINEFQKSLLDVHEINNLVMWLLSLHEIKDSEIEKSVIHDCIIGAGINPVLYMASSHTFDFNDTVDQIVEKHAQRAMEYTGSEEESRFARYRNIPLNIWDEKCYKEWIEAGGMMGGVLRSFRLAKDDYDKGTFTGQEIARYMLPVLYGFMVAFYKDCAAISNTHPMKPSYYDRRAVDANDGRGAISLLKVEHLQTMLNLLFGLNEDLPQKQQVVIPEAPSIGNIRYNYTRFLHDVGSIPKFFDTVSIWLTDVARYTAGQTVLLKKMMEHQERPYFSIDEVIARITKGKE